MNAGRASASGAERSARNAVMMMKRQSSAAPTFASRKPGNACPRTDAATMRRTSEVPVRITATSTQVTGLIGADEAEFAPRSTAAESPGSSATASESSDGSASGLDSRAIACAWAAGIGGRVKGTAGMGSSGALAPPTKAATSRG